MTAVEKVWPDSSSTVPAGATGPLASLPTTPGAATVSGVSSLVEYASLAGIGGSLTAVTLTVTVAGVLVSAGWHAGAGPLQFAGSPVSVTVNVKLSGPV